MAFIPIIQQNSDIMAQNSVSIGKLIQLSETDEPTHVYNKHKFNEMVVEYYPAVEHITALFIDINNLKQVNDTCGHTQGDKMITAVADCIVGLATGSRKV